MSEEFSSINFDKCEGKEGVRFRRKAIRFLIVKSLWHTVNPFSNQPFKARLAIWKGTKVYIKSIRLEIQEYRYKQSLWYRIGQEIAQLEWW